ncbi:MAG: tetratricopeptide repeat protein [Bacteroidetes bacterium]|nr:MAG: tetratricopeptide repeat protein [Bacteroidota bacterium]
MSKNSKTQQESVDSVESINQTLSSTEQWIERNRKWLLISVVAVVAVVLGVIGYRNMVMAPREHDSQVQAIYATQQFHKDSFELALNGDGNGLGFLQLIEDYPSTKIGNLAHYYAGVCYMELGQYEEALAQLKAYEADDKMLAPIALGAAGDCLVELGKEEEGLSYYKKAAGYKENILTAPIYLMKQGILYERGEKWSEALAAYKTIKNDYPESQQARDIEKFISRAEQQNK